MRQLAVSALALALGAAAAVALASCGGGEDAKLLPGNTAQEITENLDRIKQYAEEGECVGAEDAVAEVNDQIATLGGVDPKLVAALQRGTSRLNEVVVTCEEEPLETVEPSAEATTTERPPKTPPGQEKKAEKEQEKEEKTQEKEEDEQEEGEAPPAEAPPAEPPTTAPPSESGGTVSPGGVSPGEPAEPGGD